MPKSTPLPNQRHEQFSILVSQGSKLIDAYKAAGFSGEGKALSDNAAKLRARPEVKERIERLALDRVNATSRAFQRRVDRKGQLLQRALAELEDIAFADIGELVQWYDEPVYNQEGELLRIDKKLAVKDTAKMHARERKAIKGVELKQGGQVKLELHDKRLALEGIIKLLSGNDNPPQQVTVNQVNIGAMPALDLAQRISFLLAKAQANAPPMIEAQPVQVSQDTDDKSTP